MFTPQKKSDVIPAPAQSLIALYGGSFNPPTLTHLRIARAIRDQSGAKEVWLMVSLQNPFKNRQNMADFAHRLRMAELLVEGEAGLKAVNIEQQYGLYETAPILQRLKASNPDKRFVWVMGADNFIDFHTWGDWRAIADHFPILIAPRLGFTEVALHAPAAKLLANRAMSQLASPAITTGWAMLDMPEDDVSATKERAAIATSARPPQLSHSVQNYIAQHKLYL